MIQPLPRPALPRCTSTLGAGFRRWWLAGLASVWCLAWTQAQGIYAVTRRTRIPPAMGVFLPPVTNVTVSSLPLPNTSGQGQAQGGSGFVLTPTYGPKADPAEVARRTVEFQQKRAADGSPSAQYDLAVRHLTGDGVPLDRAAALRWLEASAKGGNPRAAERLAELRKVAVPAEGVKSQQP